MKMRKSIHPSWFGLAGFGKYWIFQDDRYQRYAGDKNCFVAVGLSHLMFECGLINQLSALGYKIAPIEVR